MTPERDDREDRDRTWERDRASHDMLDRVAQIQQTVLQRLGVIEVRLDGWEKRADTFITKDKFAPVQSFVFGMISVILLGVLAGVLRLLIH